MSIKKYLKYIINVKKKPTYQELNVSGKYPQLNNQLNYLQSLKREIEGRKFKAAKISSRCLN